MQSRVPAKPSGCQIAPSIKRGVVTVSRKGRLDFQYGVWRKSKLGSVPSVR